MNRLCFLLPLLASTGYARAAPTSLHLEAEDATLSGPTVQTTRPGFTGKGYVSGLTKDGDRIEWTLPSAKAGIYEARLRYASPSGPKGCDLVVNSAKTSAMLPQSDAFTSASLGKVELRQGLNTLGIEKGWGYYDVDALDLVPSAPSPALPKPPREPVDHRATPEARALLSLLVNAYGNKTLSGQYDEADTAYITQTTGQTPAIRGGDLIDYSPSRAANGAKPDGTTEKLIAVAQAGQIVTLSWHWNAPSHLINGSYQNVEGKTIEAPWWRGFYTDASTFDLSKALADPASSDYKLLLSDMDAIAAQLKKFSDAGVPVLWRPLHEAEGGWFWWGAKGPDAFKTLWRLMFDRMTRVHGLHNLIWVDSSGGDPRWYPGDDVVDIVGVDAYPSDSSDPLSATWDKLARDFGTRKLLTLSEFSHVPDVEKMRRFGVRWSYFVSWTGDLGPKPMASDELKRRYTQPAVANLSELNTLRASLSPAPTSAPLAPTKANFRAIGAQVEANLRQQVLNQWFPRAINARSGGFDQNFDEKWAPLPGDERSVVYQARLTWLASQAALHYPREGATWKRYASHGADFLRRQMWDTRNGGFFWEISKGVPAFKGQKHAYGNAFAIYALAAHFQATGDARSLRLAQRGFAWLDAHAHDVRNGGYYEALSREGRPILAPQSAQEPNDLIGTRFGFKSMNTHIHLLEAFAALYEIWPDPTLGARLREVFGLVRDTITVSPPGAMNLYFRPDWKTVPDRDSFGHDIETAFLLVEAAKALGMPDDAKTWSVARALVDHTLDFGFDAQSGGTFDTGGAFSGVLSYDKQWWPQAETLNALLLMHERYGLQTPRYWNAFVKQWRFIQTFQVDARYGGWRRHVSKEDAPFEGENKSDSWTEGYHQGRALLGVAARLGRLSAVR